MLEDSVIQHYYRMTRNISSFLETLKKFVNVEWLAILSTKFMFGYVKLNLEI